MGGILFFVFMIILLLAIIVAVTWYKFFTWKYNRDKQHELDLKRLEQERPLTAPYMEEYRQPLEYDGLHPQSQHVESLQQQQQQRLYGELK